MAIVSFGDYEYSFIDKEGKLQDRRYHRTFGVPYSSRSYSEGFAIVELKEFKDRKYSFIDKEGNLQDGRYRWAEPYSEGFAAVGLENGDYTFIDKDGRFQNGRYKLTRSYSEGFAAVQLDDEKWAFIDKEGNLQGGRYKDVWYYNEGFAPIQLYNEKWAFVDRDGKLQDGRYLSAKPYSNGFAAVRLDDGQCAFVDREGKLQDGRYVRTNSYSEGLGEVQLKGTNWAFDGSVFPEGFIDPLHGGKYAFIDKNGKLQDERYLWITRPYMEGLAGVWLEDGKATFIDKECNYYFDKKDWIKYIKKHPEYYSKIPPHRFEDEDFMENINNILNEYYTTALEKGEISANEVSMAMSAIEDKNKIVTQELQRRREEIEKIKQNIQINKQGQKEDTQLTATTKKELNSFFAKNYINNSENDDDERE